MNATELKLHEHRMETNADYNYIFQERLGILCGNDLPTYEQFALAKNDADQYCNKICE